MNSCFCMCHVYSFICDWCHKKVLLSIVAAWLDDAAQYILMLLHMKAPFMLLHVGVTL